MKAMTYSGPDGSVVVKPSPEFLEHLIFGGRGRHWRLGNGDSGLAVEEHRGGGRARGARATRQNLPNEPTLAFFLVERHGFFFAYFRPGRNAEQFVPFAGGERRPWVEHVVGGATMYVPRACFVSRPFAWEIVRYFVRTRRRSPAVPWVSRYSLRSPDERPPKVDLA